MNGIKLLLLTIITLACALTAAAQDTLPLHADTLLKQDTAAAILPPPDTAALKPHTTAVATAPHRDTIKAETAPADTVQAATIWDKQLNSNVPRARAGAVYKSELNKISTFANNTFKNSTFALLLLGIAFFIFTRRHYARHHAAAQPLPEDALSHNNAAPAAAAAPPAAPAGHTLPIAETLLFITALSTLAEPLAPRLYIHCAQALLMLAAVVCSISIKGRRHSTLLIALALLLWAYLGSIYFLADGVVFRIWLMALNLAALGAGYLLFKHKAPALPPAVLKILQLLFAMVMLGAITCLAIGRLSLGISLGIAGLTAACNFSALQLLAMVMVHAARNYVNKQIAAGSPISHLNIPKLHKRIAQAVILLLFAAALCTFLNVAGIARPVYSFLGYVLNTSHGLGKLSFTLGNLGMFVLLIWLTSKVQRYVGLLFGTAETGFTVKKSTAGTKVALVRLIIIIIGFLMAIAASGISVDKLTVVLGALSVGIGLGLQSIVNNFVSGVVLIFEKPFEIGDYIELADKKGKVQDIGVRASKLLTPQGSRLIIPNGDLLSGRLINYTAQNTYVKTELTFKVASGTDLSKLKLLTQEEINKTRDAVKSIAPQVLVDNISAAAYDIKVQVWVSSIYTEAAFKSYLLQKLMQRFNAEGIALA